MNCSAFVDIKVSSVHYCQSNGTKHRYTEDSSYSNSAPSVSVGVPDNETFGDQDDSKSAAGRVGLGSALSMVVPLLAAMAVIL